VFIVYAAQALYGGLDVWERVSSGTTDADFVDHNGLLPYLGGLRVGFDIALLVLAVVPLVLLWLPVTRRYYGRG
jgi:hypothetical protein